MHAIGGQTPCIVCGVKAEVSTPKRKQKICSQKCYDEMVKSVEVYGNFLIRKEQDAKEKRK